MAAQGERALVGGDTAAGLEGWVYPLQIFRGLTPSFRVGGSATFTDGRSLLRTIEYSPTFIERTYLAPEFTVRERLFVPRNLPGAILTYTVQSQAPIAVKVAFTPVFDLMWPVGTGGQEVHWRSTDQAYRMDEPTGRFFALLGSPDAREHDDIINTHAPLTASPTLHLVLGPSREVRLIMASDASGWDATKAVYTTLLTHGDDLAREAAAGVAARRQSSTRIETPDPDVNQALAWSQQALDEAWVCNPKLGCGLVAGFGPSRGLARRPQYDWFFSDDALVSLPAILDSGEFTRARDALLFLLKYQDPATGMMWHELSQSAAYVDWVHEYPYMFPHVDTTFRFLVGVGEYMRATGDGAFAAEHWAAIAAAFQYCNSLTNPVDGLPRVPEGKEGHDEQEHPREELALALDWMEAAEAYADLAAAAGHPELEAGARAQAEHARTLIPEHFWNAGTGFWNSGLDAGGNGIGERRMPSPASFALLDPQRRDEVLKRIAGPAFETPWGARGVDSSSLQYDPNSYATGSVWATSTAEAAEDLWQGHMAAEAWSIWRRLLPWLRLDALGHVHETLSATAYEPQVESVPEQTWSSALLFSSFVSGLAGIRQDASQQRLVFAPQLPADWSFLKLHRVRVGAASVDLQLTRLDDALELKASTSGSAISLVFRPQLATGKSIEKSVVDGRTGCQRTTAESGECMLSLPPDGTSHTILFHVSPSRRSQGGF